MNVRMQDCMSDKKAWQTRICWNITVNKYAHSLYIRVCNIYSIIK